MAANDEQHALFADAIKQRFEEFVDWVVANGPTYGHTMDRKDFDDCRKHIAVLAADRSDINEQNKAIPEPSENGPQYVNVTPTPWP